MRKLLADIVVVGGEGKSVCDGIAVATELRCEGQIAFKASDIPRCGDEADESLTVGEDGFNELTLFESDTEQAAFGCFVCQRPAVEGVFVGNSCIDDRRDQESEERDGGKERSPGRGLKALPKIADTREGSGRSEDGLGGTDE